MQIAEDAHDSGGNRDGADHHLRGKRGARKQTRPTTTPLCTWPSWGRNGLLPGASAITVGLLSAGAHASAPFPGCTQTPGIAVTSHYGRLPTSLIIVPGDCCPLSDSCHSCACGGHAQGAPPAQYCDLVRGHGLSTCARPSESGLRLGLTPPDGPGGTGAAPGWGGVSGR